MCEYEKYKFLMNFAQTPARLPSASTPTHTIHSGNIVIVVTDEIMILMLEKCARVLIIFCIYRRGFHHSAADKM